MKPVTIKSNLENRGHYVPGILAGGMLYYNGPLVKTTVVKKCVNQEMEIMTLLRPELRGSR